uniref:Uncharacterized protein n=1 Tax=candidate division WWE3 bacterium TaxID=2053526 RepID=A0A832DUR6_UNCKA
MINLTMGYWSRFGKIRVILKEKAGLIAALSLIFAGYLGVQAWNSQTTARAVAEAAFTPEQIFAQVSADRRWILLGEEFTFKQKSLPFRVELSPEFADTPLNYAVSGTDLSGRMVKDGVNRYFAEIFVGTLKPGRYAVSAQARSSAGTFTSPAVEFYVSYPLYVAWTLDWEGYDVPQNYLNMIEEISQNHGVPITHFFNPRLYTSPDISAAQAQYLTDWVKNRENQGDVIGLHLHMFPDLVSAAGVAPRTSPNWGSWKTDGYDVLTSAYTYEETVKLLDWSKGTFARKGLGIPVMFRAGGWFADEETLQALAETGFALDSSGRTKYTFGENGIAGPWDLLATTRPYQLNAEDQNIVNSPTLNLWEFPNNGADSWAYSTEQLLERFQSNFSGAPLAEKQVVTYLSHPEWFSKDQPKIEALFAAIDSYRNRVDGGPVIYITLGQAYQIWAGR